MAASRNPAHASTADETSAGTVRVWDPLVRIFHWCVATCILLNYFLLSGGKPLHRFAGYAVAAVLCVRVVWGFIGTGYARFSAFVTGPRVALSYLEAILKRNNPRHVGHNPAGGWMILALMLVIAVLCVSGWLQETDAFWGVEWVQTTHQVCANLVVAMAAVHVTGALVESVLHRENLVRAMITGRKRSASGTDIDHADTARRR
jgi:cytochrome b